MCKKTPETLDKSTNTEEIEVETVIENAPIFAPFLTNPNLSQVPQSSLCEHVELQHSNPRSNMETLI